MTKRIIRTKLAVVRIPWEMMGIRWYADTESPNRGDAPISVEQIGTPAAPLTESMSHDSSAVHPSVSASSTDGGALPRQRGEYWGRKWRFLATAILALLLGAWLGRVTDGLKFGHPPTSQRVVDLEQIAASMYTHQDSCVQDYDDGVWMAQELKDPFLHKKFLQREGYLTHLDVELSRDVWMENCMYRKEIYNRVGLGR